MANGPGVPKRRPFHLCTHAQPILEMEYSRKAATPFCRKDNVQSPIAFAKTPFVVELGLEVIDCGHSPSSLDPLRSSLQSVYRQLDCISRDWCIGMRVRRRHCARGEPLYRRVSVADLRRYIFQRHAQILVDLSDILDLGVGALFGRAVDVLEAEVLPRSSQVVRTTGSL